jgi:hypothetical protein
MKVRTLIAGAAVMLLCGGLGVCVAEEAPTPAPLATPEAAPSSAPAPKPKHHRKHHRGKHHAAREFSEQELQEFQAHPPSK